jgi:hypothetical protein
MTAYLPVVPRSTIDPLARIRADLGFHFKLHLAQSLAVGTPFLHRAVSASHSVT